MRNLQFWATLNCFAISVGDLQRFFFARNFKLWPIMDVFTICGYISSKIPKIIWRKREDIFGPFLPHTNPFGHIKTKLNAEMLILKVFLFNQGIHWNAFLFHAKMAQILRNYLYCWFCGSYYIFIGVSLFSTQISAVWRNDGSFKSQSCWLNFISTS